MANETKDWPLWLQGSIVLVAIAVVLIGIAVIVAVAKIATATAPAWLLGLFWVVFPLIPVVLIPVLAIWFLPRSLGKAADEFADLAKRHPKGFKEAKKRTPTFVVVALFVSEAVVILADHSFEGKTLALMVSFAMLIAFWVANELMIRTGLPRGVGIAAWAIGILILPGAVWADRRAGVRDLGRQLWLLPTATKSFFGVAALLIVALPFLIRRNPHEE